MSFNYTAIETAHRLPLKAELKSLPGEVRAGCHELVIDWPSCGWFAL